MNDEKVKIYVPDRHFKMGLGIWKEMFQELIWRFFLRDFNAYYLVEKEIFGDKNDYQT